MVSPFNITFIETFGVVENSITCDHFHVKSDKSFLSQEVKLTENSELRLLFDAPEGYKLYMDGLDQLEERLVHEDARGVYVRPSKLPIHLFSPRLNSKPYPFIPGTYFLLLVTDEGKELEARAKVMTKRITETQHEIMVDEIEEAVKGLSTQLTSRRKIYSEIALDIFGPEKINEYSIILMNKEKIINSIHTINKKRKFSIRKVYPVIPRAKAKRVDEKSIKYLMMHPEQQKTIQAPVSEVTYELLENGWIKTISALILKYVIEMKNCFQTPFSSTYNQEQAQKLEKEITTLQNQLSFFLNEQWIRALPEKTSSRIPMVFFMDGTYNAFYKIYQLLKQNQSSTITEPKLQFHYKRSDLLYEIWGYLKIIGIFKDELGYTLKKNWFSMDQNTLDEVIVPKQHDSDYVELALDEYTIRLFYDEIIPNGRDALSSLHTMYTMNNNKPDCRIDVWENTSYKGSLIIDFKYRKKEYLWNDEDLRTGKQPSKVMKQLESYSSGMKSYTLDLNGHKNRLIDVQPVTEVWAVYPIKRDVLNSDYSMNDYDIRLIDLSPGSNSSHFSTQLKQAIEEIIER